MVQSQYNRIRILYSVVVSSDTNSLYTPQYSGSQKNRGNAELKAESLRPFFVEKLGKTWDLTQSIFPSRLPKPKKSQKQHCTHRPPKFGFRFWGERVTISLTGTMWIWTG